jgi:hypothetical protein
MGYAVTSVKAVGLSRTVRQMTGLAHPSAVTVTGHVVGITDTVTSAWKIRLIWISRTTWGLANLSNPANPGVTETLHASIAVTITRALDITARAMPASGVTHTLSIVIISFTHEAYIIAGRAVPADLTVQAHGRIKGGVADTTGMAVWSSWAVWCAAITS